MNFDFEDILGGVVIFILIVTFAGLMVAISSFAYQEVFHPCIESHRELVHHHAWTQLMPAGKVLIPIYHPGVDSLDDVCDKRK